jgi:hypothetical protein
VVVTALVVLQDLAFGDRLPSQHPDVLDFWLPNYCFLGRSLAAGHVPAWNPHVMAGLPFAADPQSGWMYAPPMLLFTLLSCATAMRWIIVLQPVLGGLGLYWFLRGEGLARSAATAGGVGLAGLLAGSRLALFLPFPSAFAWTALALAACSRMLRAERWSSRLAWGGATALAWGQLAAAHFAHGAAIGTLALVAFVAAKAWARRREGGGGAVMARAAALVPVMVLVNLAFFLPRLAYISSTSYGPGYTTLAPLEGLEAIGWPLALASPPGGYLGMTALGLTVAGFWAPRRRHLAVAFGTLGALGYVASLHPVATALEPVVRGVPLLDFYVHFPGRLGLALILVLPILGALGIQAWIEAPRESVGRRLPMVLPGALLWLAWPLAVGVVGAQLPFLVAGSLGAGAALALAAARPALAALLPAVLAAELVWSGLAGLPVSSLETTRLSPVDRLGPPSWLTPLLEPNVDSAAYLETDPIVRTLRSNEPVRYLTVPRSTERGPAYLVPQSARNWGLETNQRAMLFGIDDVQGYNPVQLARYWRFARSVTVSRIPYNVSLFERPQPSALDLLQVGFLIDEEGRPPEPGATPVASRGGSTLYRRAEVPPRAWTVTSWTVAGSAERALGLVTAEGFDASARAVLERDGEPPSPAPSSLPGGGMATASFVPLGPQAARVTIAAPSTAILVVSIPFHDGWHAELDGRAAPLIRADYVLQGLVIPPGRHTVELSYDDPWIGYGLLGSAVSTLALGALIVMLRRRESVAVRTPARRGVRKPTAPERVTG